MQVVDASRDEAQLAVRLYNDPAETRSFEAFVVHMHLAWLYLLHGEFTRDDVDFRYWRWQGRARRLDRVDGEPKRWDLATCVRHRWPDDKDPVRANLTFFIRLRNKIEHRYARQQEALTAAVGGQSQALLLNYLKRSLRANSGPGLHLRRGCAFRCSSAVSPPKASERCGGCGHNCRSRCAPS
ncbi:DUF3644 domain-containing protein [Amycolatopsis carbonis]|uniref:DUF3644 domain-containing protein n=1 Tax=Amycolatopsis carbonis TaxID=715471 RepID=UPI00333E9DCD